MKEVAALGGIMDDVLVQQSADYVDNQARVAVAFQGIKNAIGKGLLPVLIEMQNGFVDWLKVNGKWIRQGLALVFSRLGQIVKRVGGFFGRLAAQFAEWSKKLDPVSKSLLKISAIALGVAATLMLPGGSIILMGALLALLIEDFEVWREGGNSAIGELIKGFDKLFDTNVEQDAKDFFNGLNQFWFDYFTDSEKAWDKFGFEVKEILKGYLDTYIDMWKLMGSKYLDIWKFIGTSIVNAWDKYWSDLRALQDKQNAEFTAKFEKFKTKLGEIWNALGTSFSEMFPGLEESWDTFWDELFQSSSDFVDKIVDSFLRLKDAIIQPIKDVSKEIRSVFGLEDVPDNVVQIAKGAKSLAGGQATRETFSGPRRASRFGALPSSVAVSQNNKTDIHVQAAPGQSVNSLAQSIDGQARKVQEQDLRRAAKAFVPKKAAAQ
ncbi:MAG: hypothetical protein GY841_21270 [FCB group bacterium]|nr:hypothetical protein [FCB group bacterium]